MPIYDVKCSDCGSEASIRLSFQEIDAWDKSARCPQCERGDGVYRRIIKQAAFHMGSKARPGIADRLADAKKNFANSTAHDEMRHKALAHRNPDTIAAAVESVKKGEFENF